MTNQILANDTIELKPSYKLPFAIIIGGLLLLFLQKILAVVVILFGIFLTIQANLIKLKFTDETLEVYRQDTKIRSFPYDEWQNWAIFWQPLPILFYFKEVKSIHFLPIIFDDVALKNSLEKYITLK